MSQHEDMQLIAVRCSAGRYPLEALLEDCRAYVKTTGRRPTFEYTLLAGVNDSIAQVG